ncbi:tautomerase family protein [Bacillus sp. T3]|nr:tautomerase family protein [Bacillus sp. T3]
MQINILKGRSPGKKEILIRRVTDTVADVLEAPGRKRSCHDQ